MKPSVEILIPNRYSFNGIVLTVESILKRTRYKGPWSITVCDNSLASNRLTCEPHKRLVLDEDDGNRRLWLRIMARTGELRLIENTEQREGEYGHGANLRLLCDQCSARYALLINSSTEVVRGDWIDVLVDAMHDPARDLGVARFRDGGNHFDVSWITPNYWPNYMLLDMPLYRQHFPAHEWTLKQVPFDKFERPEVFAGMAPPAHPEYDPPLVFCDTGWTLYEKLRFDNPAGLRMLPLPDNYWNSYVRWRGGIDRNSHRPDHEYVRQTLAETERALVALRSGV
jgi:hypothetical protein